MNKFGIGLFAAVLFAAVCAGPARAQTPIDPTGIVSGWVPPAQGILKCERYMNKRVSLVANCALSCTIKDAKMIFRGLPFDNTQCIDTGAASCQAKYNRSLGLLDQSLCPTCLDPTTEAGLYTEYHDLAETLNASYFCDSTNSVPFGNGVSGFASRQRDVSKCEGLFARNVFKLVKCLNLKCHRAVADDLFFGRPAFDVNQCEDTDPVQSCHARYEKANANLSGCPTCLDVAHREQVYTSVKQALDSRNVLPYCAQ